MSFNKPFLVLTLKLTGAQEPQTLSHPLSYSKAVRVQMADRTTASLRREDWDQSWTSLVFLLPFKKTRPVTFCRCGLETSSPKYCCVQGFTLHEHPWVTKDLGSWGNTQKFGGEVHHCRHTGRQLASFSVCEDHCAREKLSNHQWFCCGNPNRQGYIRRTRKKLQSSNLPSSIWRPARQPRTSEVGSSYTFMAKRKEQQLLQPGIIAKRVQGIWSHSHWVKRKITNKTNRTLTESLI